MKAAVIVFPGINRERDMARTLRLVSGREPAMVAGIRTGRKGPGSRKAASRFANWIRDHSRLNQLNIGNDWIVVGNFPSLIDQRPDGLRADADDARF